MVPGRREDLMNHDDHDREGMQKHIRKDAGVLAHFVEIFCAHQHGRAPRAPLEIPPALADALAGVQVTLCEECRRLVLHGAMKRMQCPHHPKPSCKHCPAPCYAPGYRKQIRQVMRFSGARLILGGRMRLLWKYLF